MPRVLLASPHSKSECQSRLAASFDGRMAFRWLTWANVSPERRVLGRIDGDDVRAVIIRPGPRVALMLPSRVRALALFRSGFQVLTAHMTVRRDGGTAILADVGQPMGDTALLSVGIGIILAAIEGDPIFLAAIPPGFVFLVSFNSLFRRPRLEADANELLRRLSVALDARPVRRRTRVSGGTPGPQVPYEPRAAGAPNGVGEGERKPPIG